MPGTRPEAKPVPTNCGRSVFRAKLQDLEARYGVTPTEVHATQGSQTS
jgi:hypothetical protein